MIAKIKNILINYKYLIKTKFYLSRPDIFLLFVISFLSLILSFLVIFLSIPFLDMLLGKEVAEQQEFTKILSNILNIFNLETSFLSLSTIFVLTIIFKSILDIIYQYFSVKLQFKYMLNAGLNLNKIIFNMSQFFFMEVSTSKILNLYTKELDRSSEVISSFFLSINALLQLLIFLAVPFYLNPKFTLLFLILILILISPLLIINFLTIKLGFVATKINDELFRTLNNNFSYSKIIIIHGLLEKANSFFLKPFKSVARNKIQLTVLGGISRNFIQPAGILAIIIPIYFFMGKVDNLPVLGGILWSLTRTLSPINIILQALNIINSQIGAFKNLYNTKNSFSSYQIKDGKSEVDNFEKLSLANVNFKYDEKKILDKVSLDIFSGEKIAIVGDIGSGKSTLLDIMTNVTNVISGERKINNINYDEIDFQKFRQKISYVPQTLSALDANVKEFFYYFNSKEIEEKKINHFLDMMECNSFLGNKPDRINIYLGDKGIRISGGQKQKIVLAAALSREPELLILDECTNALDLMAEKSILKKIIDNKSLTLIFISHKLPKDKIFDKIYKVENNNLVLV